MLFVVWMSFNDRCKSLDFSAVLLLVLRYFSPVLSPLNFHWKWTVGFKSLHQVWSRYETRTQLGMLKDLKELAHMVFLCVIFVLILSSLFFVPWVKHLYVGQFWRCHSRISRLVNLVSWIIALGRVYIYIYIYIYIHINSNFWHISFISFFSWFKKFIHQFPQDAFPYSC